MLFEYNETLKRGYIKNIDASGEPGNREIYIAPDGITICNELQVRNKMSRELAIGKLQNMDTDTIIGPFYCDQSHTAWYWNFCILYYCIFQEYY